MSLIPGGAGAAGGRAMVSGRPDGSHGFRPGQGPCPGRDFFTR
ncbi:hypothetical protein DVDV_3004 [Desulfovibrio sp. DV]|nr:hypothetical protein DVDV_3004 [Desulfovibrio sp. DV]